MKLLGICGPTGSGKSTLALRASVELTAMPLAFGDELKRFCAEQYGNIPQSEFGWTGINWTGPKTQRGRGILKAEGELARKRDKQRWIRPLEALLQPFSIIHDVRHLAEIEWIVGKGGYIMVLEGDAAPDNHPSEMEWRAYAYDYGLKEWSREEAWKEVLAYAKS